MKSFKNINLFFVLGVLFPLVGCSFDYSLPSHPVEPAYNDIDAVTSASGDIQVTGGKAYADNAQLETYHKDTYKLHWIEYGTSLSYGFNILVADTPSVQSVTIHNLKSNTRYYFNFNGSRPGEEGAIHNVKGTFTTVSGTPISLKAVNFN